MDFIKQFEKSVVVGGELNIIMIIEFKLGQEHLQYF